MNEELLAQKIAELEQKLDRVYVSSERLRKYFQWSLIAMVVMFVLPLIGLLFALPSFLSYYGTIANFNF